MRSSGRRPTTLRTRSRQPGEARVCVFDRTVDGHDDQPIGRQVQRKPELTQVILGAREQVMLTR